MTDAERLAIAEEIARKAIINHQFLGFPGYTIRCEHSSNGGWVFYTHPLSPPGAKQDARRFDSPVDSLHDYRERDVRKSEREKRLEEFAKLVMHKCQNMLHQNSFAKDTAAQAAEALED